LRGWGPKRVKFPLILKENKVEGITIFNLFKKRKQLKGGKNVYPFQREGG
jgi:hypothetical protein